MKKASSFILVLLLSLCIFHLPIYSQSRETGAFQGIVATPEGEFLPGVEVTVSSPALIGGSQSRVTDANGKFRFPVLPPGSYLIEARLQGFTPQRRENIKLSVEQTLTVDFALEIGSLDESVLVIAKVPTIDIKDSQIAATEMPREFLEKIPGSRTMREELNLSPASYVGSRHKNVSMYGSTESLASNFYIDGVKVNSPEAGEPEVLFSFNSIEEMKIMGLGAPAEYGGFSGAVIHTITKSGGNKLGFLANFFINPPSWHSENWGDYPDLLLKSFLYKIEGFLNLSGPIMQDKLWFYLGGNYIHDAMKIEDFTGPVRYQERLRYLGKLSWQIGRNDKVSQLLEYSTTTWGNRDVGPLYAPEVGYDVESWQLFWNTTFLHVFSDTTFFDARFGGYHGLKREPEVDKTLPTHRDLETGYRSGNATSFWEDDRTRMQLNTSITHHAEDFLMGSHDFKVGAQLEISYAGNYYGWPGGKLYQDLGGESYLLQTNYTPDHFGFKSKGRTTRMTGFVQDSWTIGRLTINPGLRINAWKGNLMKYDETDSAFDDNPAFSPNIGIAPRIGFTLDVFGDHTTAVKAHFGRYYHGMIATFYLHFKPQGPRAKYQWVDNDWQLLYSDPWEEKYTLDPNLKMPYMDQFTIGFERELAKDFSIGVTYIHRDNYNLMSRVNLTGIWEPMQWTAPTGKTFTVYQRINPGDNKFLITNPQAGEDYGAAFPDIVSRTPTRNYRGLQFTFAKRYSNRWMMQASYILSKAEGTDDNSWGDYAENRSSMLGSCVSYSNPNWQINYFGTLSYSPTHIFKIMGAWDIPVINTTFGAIFNLFSGKNYTKELLLPDSIDPDPVAEQSNIWIYEERKGGYREPTQTNLDLRLEKFFMLGKFRISAMVDIFNALNSNAEHSLEHRDDPRSDFPFQYVWEIKLPRTFRLGFRIEF